MSHWDMPRASGQEDDEKKNEGARCASVSRSLNHSALTMARRRGASLPMTPTSPNCGSDARSNGSPSPQGVARFVASTSDIDRRRAAIEARWASNVLKPLPTSDAPSSSKSDSTASAKPWLGANVKTLHRVVLDKETGQSHTRVSSGTWAEMSKRYQESTQQERNERLNHETFGYVWCTLVAIAVIAIIVGLSHFLSRRRHSALYSTSSRSTVASDDLSQLCVDAPTNDSCRTAIWELRRTIDFDIAPCHDFHQYACGRWRPKVGGDTSYLSQETQLFNSLVHDTLLNVSFDIQEGKPAPYGAPVHQMAQFHASCYWMFTGRNSGGNINDVMEALRINLESWITVRSAEELVELTVSTSLRTGLSAFVNVRLLKGDVLLDVGSTIAKAFVYKPGRKQYLVEAVIELGVNMSNAVQRMMDLDYKVDGLLIASNEINALRKPTVQELARLFPRINWINAFNRDRPELLPTVANDTKISLSGATFIKDALDIFRQEQHAVTGLYGLLSIMSTVMKYSYYARYVSFKEPFAGVNWCLLLTAWHFSKLYPAWLGAEFLNFDSTARFKKAFNEAMTVVLSDNIINYGVFLDTALLSRTWLNIFGEPTYVVPMSADSGPVSMNGTFLPNLAAVIAAQVGTVDRDAVFVESHDFVMGELGYGQRREGKFAIPPALVASKGLLSLQLPDVNVGLFTLRYLILRAIYERAATYQSGEAPVTSRIPVRGSGMAGYVLSCFGQSLRKSLNKSLDESAIKSLMGGRWAALTALAMTERDPVTSGRLDIRARRRLLFLALCASGCGDPDDADHCRDMSRVMPDFVDAYGCARDADHKCDCSAVNNCETHLPSVTD